MISGSQAAAGLATQHFSWAAWCSSRSGPLLQLIALVIVYVNPGLAAWLPRAIGR